MKRYALLLTACCLLCACQSSDPPVTPQTTVEPQPFAEDTPVEPLTVYPLPITLDVQHLDDCTVPVSFENSDIHVDNSGTLQMMVTVYTYDLYDMVDISLLKEGDTLVRNGEHVSVTTLERSENGTVLINGGLDAGGFELCTEENGVFFESGYSDVKSYYPIGEATLPVSPDFTYIDRSDLDNDPVIWFPGDFLALDNGLDFYFTPHNTTLVIENGIITSMERIYVP